MAKVYIGIGSNLGQRNENIEFAIRELEKTGVIRVRKTSSIYETEPVGGPPQGRFLNGVMEIDTDLPPTMLLERLQDIESRMGRVRQEVDGPRIIDLDILLYDDQVFETPELTIPHPRMSRREFVLKGLREIAPDIEVS
ncbi:MAG: 2-amino-4-hydroxy-6-hydroxymethyldihydropteridine diphosphokinase [Candidatus Omnitrophota bacterium]